MSDTDTESDGEMEMLWGSRKGDEKDSEPGVAFQIILQEMNAQVSLSTP